MKRRLLIVEPQALMQQGLCALLGAEPDFEVVACASDGQSAALRAADLAPDLLITELALPGLSGIEVISTLRRHHPHLQVLVLTDSRAEGDVRAVLALGVTGYVLKDSSYEDLLHALRTVARGKSYLSPDVSSQVVQRFLRPHEPTQDDALGASLTRRERSVLQLVAQGGTNRLVAAALHLSPKTVEKHRASLMRKLGLSSISELTLTALEMGLIQRPSRP